MSYKQTNYAPPKEIKGQEIERFTIVKMLCKNIQMIESVAKDSGLRTLWGKGKTKVWKTTVSLQPFKLPPRRGPQKYKVETSTDTDGLIRAGHGIDSPMVPTILRQVT